MTSLIIIACGSASVCGFLILGKGTYCLCGGYGHGDRFVQLPHVAAVVGGVDVGDG